MTIIDIVKYISVLGLLRLNDMEKRKLMALGKSSIVIAIPKHWLQKSKLEKGDTVHLNIQSDGSLGVYPNSVEDKRNEIDLIIAEDDNSDIIIRRLISCYLNGFSLVHLSSKNIFSTIQQETIREITRTLYMRIMKASSKEITIQSTLDESMDSIFSGINVNNWPRYFLVAVPSICINLGRMVSIFLSLTEFIQCLIARARRSIAHISST